jgi:hypothetical protein
LLPRVVQGLETDWWEKDFGVPWILPLSVLTRV